MGNKRHQRLNGKRYGDWLRRGLIAPLTMTGLAKALGLPVSSVSRMASNERRIKAEELQVISDYIQQPLPVAQVAKTATSGHDEGELLEILGGVDWQRVDGKIRALPMPSQRVKSKHKVIRIFGKGLLVFEPYDDERKPKVGDIAVVRLVRGVRQQLVVRRMRRAANGGYELRPLTGRTTLRLSTADISIARNGTEVEYIGVAKYRVEEL